MACLFCRIVAREIPATIVRRDEVTVAFRDINPQAPTHVLIVPAQHIANASDISLEHGAVVAAMFRAAVDIARSEGIESTGYRLVFNVGPDAGQSVDHLHMHVFGGRQLRWPPG